MPLNYDSKYKWISPYKGVHLGELCTPYLDLHEFSGEGIIELMNRDFKNSLQIPMARMSGKNPDCIALVICSGDIPIASAFIQNKKLDGKNYSSIPYLSVSKAFQGKGLSRLLLYLSLSEAKSRFKPENIEMPSEIEKINRQLDENLALGIHSQIEFCFNKIIKDPVPIALFSKDPENLTAKEQSLKLLKSNLLELPGRGTILRYKNAHLGKRCFILASGPSLNSHDLNKLRSEISFTVNRSGFLYPNATYTCSMAEHAFVSFGELLRKSKCFFTTEGRAFGVQMPVIGGEGFSFDLEKGVYAGCTISLIALQIAVYMGFRSIHFLGLDLKNTAEQTHFFGIDEQNLKHEDREFPRMRKAFQHAMEVLKDKNIIVTNSSTICELESIPFKEYESLFS